MPDSRLKNDVFPAPFGPMIPTSSPSFTSSETSATIVAPPMSSPSDRVARMGVAPTCPRGLRERLDGRLDVPGRDRLDHLWRPRALLLHQLHLEHRLEHRVVLRTDALLALRREELVPLERGDHLADVVSVRLLDRAHDHLRRHEAVRREQIRDLVTLRQRLHEPLVDLVLRPVGDVVRKQVDAAHY